MKLPFFQSLLILIVINIFYMGLLIKPGIPHTHDGDLHMARLAAYYKAFTEKQFPPRWAADLNFHYGTPVFIFYYPLPGYIGSAIHALGISIQDTFKLLLGISFVLASVSFYVWMHELIPGAPAFISSLLYGLAPYHFLDLYVRGAIGELFAFVWIPLIFCMIEKMQKNQSRYAIFFGSITYALLILSHNAMGLLFTPIIISYCIAKAQSNIALLMRYGIMLIGGLSLSAFFWIPALYEQRFTHSDLFLGSKYATYFPSIMQLIYSPWGFGTEVHKVGGLSPQIGLVAVAIILLTVLSILKWKRYKSQIFFWLAILTISLFFTTQYSLPVWTRSKFLQGFEFPWRFTALSMFCIAAASVFVLKNFNNKLLNCIFFIGIILYSVRFYSVVNYENKKDSFYTSYTHSTDFGAASTIWSAGDPSEFPKKPIQLISGRAVITSYSRSTTHHSINVSADIQSQLVDNTLYFPGWQARIDGNKKLPIQFQDANHRGLITVTIPAGTHTIQVMFTESPVRFLSDSISLSSGILWFILLYRYRRIRTDYL